MQLLRKHEEQVGRGLTYDLWKNFPADEILLHKDSNVGHGVMLDPCAPPYVVASSTNLLAGNGVRGFTDAAESIGGLTIAQYDGGQGFRMLASADNGAAELQWGGNGEQFIISDTAADAKELIFEVQFRVSTITANDLAFFIGLAGRNTLDGDFLADNVADKDAIADVDLIGIFHDHPATTALDINYQIAGTVATEHEAAWKTLAIDTWYTFGMRYLPNPGRIDFYWGSGDRTTTVFAKDDNPITSTDIAAADFPDGQGLAPTIAIKGGHANDKTLDIRTFACAQRAYPAD